VRPARVTYCPYKCDCAYYSVSFGGERLGQRGLDHEDPRGGRRDQGRTSPF